MSLRRYRHGETEVWAEQFDGDRMCYGTSSMSDRVDGVWVARHYASTEVQPTELVAGDWVVHVGLDARTPQRVVKPEVFAAEYVVVARDPDRFGADAWPARPTCHDGGRLTNQLGVEWVEHGHWRTCRYCGSMHPADVLAALAAGARLGGADWKYGWPHKFYVEGAGPGSHKWYPLHFLDQGYADEALLTLLGLVSEKSGIHFSKDEEGQIVYRAPYHGYQRMD